ncbi:MAG: radical SAM protein [Coriobacteriia bacterium]|nr:radical SAM protein [Coriobacteriia bacterium]
MDFAEYAQAFKQVEQDFEASVESFGVPFEENESSPRAERVLCAEKSSCSCENSQSSLWLNWISPACLACRTGEATSTFFVDLRCSRNCYFCFNPNQDYYEYFLSHQRDITAELDHAASLGVHFDCLAVTGGEPLLHKEEVLRFIKHARMHYPQSHIRLYTSGDFLDERTAQALGSAGLSEIRFSIKLDDEGKLPELPFKQMKMCREFIPFVMIEMPVIPGTLDSMKEILLRADAIGVKGINLLEFCFPLHNGNEFAKRGFKLRKHPYDHLYNYWYGGGIPVAGSEKEALALLEFANEQKLRLGVHYCSSDNKNTGQIFQQNKCFTAAGSALRKRYPWLSRDDESQFLICTKAFGSDAAKLHSWLTAQNAPFDFQPEILCVSFPASLAAAALKEFPGATLALSHNVFEEDEANALKLREVSVQKF